MKAVTFPCRKPESPPSRLTSSACSLALSPIRTGKQRKIKRTQCRLGTTSRSSNEQRLTVNPNRLPLSHSVLLRQLGDLHPDDVARSPESAYDGAQFPENWSVRREEGHLGGEER